MNTGERLTADHHIDHVETEEWQLGEIRTAIAELDAGQGVSHEEVSKWLNSWGKPGETKAPR
jgi:predicted transcriptional regulator